MDKLFGAISKLSSKPSNDFSRVYTSEKFVVDEVFGKRETVITILAQTTDQWKEFREQANNHRYLKVIAKQGVLTDCRSMFEGCSNVQVLDLSELDVSSVDDMGLMFARCIQIQELDLSNWLTGNVTDMSGMFKKCIGLRVLKQYFTTLMVRDVSSMFESCACLEDIGDINRWAVGNLKLADSMFEGCGALQKIDIRDWMLVNLISINRFCKGDMRLVRVFMPEDGPITSAQRSLMFEGCDALSKEGLEKWL